jgi:hypothetical protein
LLLLLLLLCQHVLPHFQTRMQPSLRLLLVIALLLPPHLTSLLLLLLLQRQLVVAAPTGLPAEASQSPPAVAH